MVRSQFLLAYLQRPLIQGLGAPVVPATPKEFSQVVQAFGHGRMIGIEDPLADGKRLLGLGNALCVSAVADMLTYFSV